MKKTIQSVLNDIEANLVGKTLHGISGSASVFKIVKVDGAKKNLVLDVNGKKRTWTFERMESVWNELYYRPAAHVDNILDGSGSSRNQIETIYANLPYVKWLHIKGKKHIAYVVKNVHPYGEIMRMDNDEEKEYEKFMNEKNPHNPYLEKDEIGVLEVQMDVVCEELKGQYSLEELADILRKMSSEAGDRMQMCSIHMFGIKYGKTILENDYKASAIIAEAGLKESFYTELQKGINIYKALVKGMFGIGFVQNEKYTQRSIYNIVGENLLLYGVPGSGKSHYIKENYPCLPQEMERVVFHPDYTYSDFVGQILPRLVTRNQEEKLEYVFTSGPFTRILQKAHDNQDKMYYLIIEEINRGNAPAIFGEIFQLLDRDLNGASEYGISNYDIAKEVYGDSSELVKIPSNLTILATMNTSDQNVFTLDTAFQRRWKMKHIPNKFNDSHANDMIEGTNVSWGGFATIINGKATDLNSGMPGSGDKRLGAYFAKFDELKKDVFPEKVLRYLWDDVFRMDKEAIFESKYKSLEDIFDEYEKEAEDKLRVVLKPDVYNQMVKTTKELKEQIENTEDMENTDE